MTSDIGPLHKSLEAYHAMAMGGMPSSEGDGSLESPPPPVSCVLRHIATTGRNPFPWVLLRAALCDELNRVLLEAVARVPLSVNDADYFETDRKFVLDHLNSLDGAPFTLQRLCELILDPAEHNSRRSDGLLRPMRFMNSVRKSVIVYTTVPPSDPEKTAVNSQ